MLVNKAWHVRDLMPKIKANSPAVCVDTFLEEMPGCSVQWGVTEFLNTSSITATHSSYAVGGLNTNTFSDGIQLLS